MAWRDLFWHGVEWLDVARCGVRVVRSGVVHCVILAPLASPSQADVSPKLAADTEVRDQEPNTGTLTP